MKKKFLTGVCAILLISVGCSNEPIEDKPVDIDGNVYRTVVIGNQEWFAENLKTTKYNDGTPIPTGHSDDEWVALTTGAYAVYPYTSIEGLDTDAEVLDAYGALYNWYAVETGKLCPKGWHVPTDAEWTALTDYLGGLDVAGVKLKSSRTESAAHPRWNSPNTGATDEYGFSALPGGYCYYSNGMFYAVGNTGYWWSSTGSNASSAWNRGMISNDGTVYRFSEPKRSGLSVRCLRDK